MKASDGGAPAAATSKLASHTIASVNGQPASQYVPHSIQQVLLIQGLQERVAELEEALNREQDRCKLLQSDLARLRLQHQWSKAGGSSGGSTPTKGLSPCRLGSMDVATMPEAGPSPFAAAQRSQGAPARAGSLGNSNSTGIGGGAPPAAAADAQAAATQPAGPEGGKASAPMAVPAAGGSGSGSGSGCGHMALCSDTVSVSRHALELLYLKERAMDAAKEGIVIADCSQPDMPLIYANEGFTRMTGYSRADVLGRNCRFLQYPPVGASDAGTAATDDTVVQVLRQSINAGLPCVVQLMNYKRNGDAFINYLSLNPVHDLSGRLTHYVGVQSDITELVQHRRAELAAKHAALQAAAATEAKSQFLARMSHEIRTPLNGMIAVGQLLADTPLSPAQWDLVNTIRCSGETLLTLITDILDFSRIEANKMVLSCTEYRLQTVIEAAMEIAGLHAAQKRLQVAYNIAQSVPSVVLGDAQRLQQILLNVLNNAVKFTERGEILLEVWADTAEDEAAATPTAATPTAAMPTAAAAVAADAQPQSQQQQQPQQQHEVVAESAATAAAGAAAAAPRSTVLQFSVRDTGIGIGSENIGRLFQSFSQVDASPTRRHGGSGLGLAICLRLCEAMGGSMWAESGGAGEGSLFRWCIRVRVPDVKPGSVRGGGGNGSTPSGSARCSLECPPVGASAGSSARSSSEVYRGIGGGGGITGLAAVGRAVSGALYDLAGRRVLLVEPCTMVRQVLALALRRFGCFVCAVSSEAEAAGRLKMAASAGLAGAAPSQPPLLFSGSSSRNGGPDSVAAQLAAQPLGGQAPGQPGPALRLRGGLRKQRRRHLELEHGGQWLEYEFQAPGPYDVVVLDMMQQSLLQTLMGKAHASEAQRVVFLGWPGQNEPEDHAEGTQPCDDGAALRIGLPPPPSAAFSEASVLSDMRDPGQAAQPPRILAEQLAQAQAPGQRQLGYAVVTRPVRQGRLRLALEEVLSMQLEPESTAGKQPASTAGEADSSSGELSTGATAGSPAAASAAPPGAAGDAMSPAVLLGLDKRGEDPASGDDASSLGSRASSSSNLRCAGATLVRATTSTQHLEAVAASNAPLRLLLAEDNAINMKVALGILKRMGCTDVVTAEDGQAAVDALHAAGGPDAFDVILMDLHMPKKGGMEAVQDIRRTWSRYNTKIIAVTADAFEDTRDNCIANGFDGWLAKPFRVEEFARVMAACRTGAALTPQRKNI